MPIQGQREIIERVAAVSGSVGNLR